MKTSVLSVYLYYFLFQNKKMNYNIRYETIRESVTDRFVRWAVIAIR